MKKNIFLTNRNDSDTIYNPVTNKMIKRNGRVGNMLTSQYKFIFSGGSMNNTSPNIPFLVNDNYWKTTPNGDPVYKCDKRCFPYDMLSHVPCLPRCLYTDMKGYDPYTQFDTFFKYPTTNQHKKKHPNKTIVITFGPPSSGKGSLKHFMQHHLDLHEDDMVDVNVDFIFQNKQFEIGQEYQKQVENIKTIYPADKHKVYTQRLYNYYRWVADQLSDLILTTAIIEKHNLKWETSGGVNLNYLKTWIDHKTKHNYQVIVIYPYVSRENLIKRIREREKKTQQTGAPEEKIDSMITTSITKFNQLKTIYSESDAVRIIQIDNNDIILDESKRKILLDTHESVSYFSSCVVS